MNGMWLSQRYFLKKMLFSDVFLFDPSIFHNSGIIKRELTSGKITSFFFFFQVNLVFFQIRNSDRKKAHDMIWSAFLC